MQSYVYSVHLTQIYMLFMLKIQVNACDPGYWGYLCQPCRFEGCICGNSDSCYGCLDGYYYGKMTVCQRCPENCLTCTDATACETCRPGYTGNTCEYAINCSSDNCVCTTQNTCDMCKVGYYNLSNKCLDNCNPNCSSCSDGTTCSTCKPGRYSASCDMLCSQGCDGGLCNKLDGTCSCVANFVGGKCDQCVPGRYRTYCDKHCSIGCNAGECNKDDGTCTCLSSFTGIKCDQCSRGKFGANCEKTCSQGCDSNGCNQVDGTCSCLQGYFGPMCEQSQYDKTYMIKCSTNCQVCNPTDGGCLSCRSTHMFGYKCDIKCSNHCVNQSCSINGDCNLGCATPFYGMRCDSPCPEFCAGSGHGSGCSQESGLCMFGCKDGYTGETCKHVSSLANSDSNGKTAGIIGGGVAAVVIVIAVVGVWICVRKWNKRRHPSTDYETTHGRVNHTSDLHLYDGLSEHENNTSHHGYCNTSVGKISTPPDQSCPDYQNSTQDNRQNGQLT